MPLTTLPNEILYHITSYLDDGAPSLKVLRREPIITLTYSKETPLKNLSSTCLFFRSLMLPLLFKFTRIPLDLSFEWDYGTGPLARDVELRRYLDFLTKNSLSSTVQGIVFYTEHAFDTTYRYANDNLQKKPHWLWYMTFSAISPSFITICAPPTTLGYLTGCKVDNKDSWAFDMPLHVLHLSRPSATECLLSAEHQDLLQIIPWTHCTINEGSSLRVYSTYEYYHKRMPSILRHVPKVIVDRGLSLRNMEYIAIFPPGKHSLYLLLLLCSSPDLERLRIQLAPHPADGILEDDFRVPKASLSDMWMEHRDFEKRVLSEMTRSVTRQESQIFNRPVCLSLSDSLGAYLEEFSEMQDDKSLAQWEKCSDGRFRTGNAMMVLERF